MDVNPIDDPWFTVEPIDENTFAISEYGHWEEVRSFLLIGTDQALLIDTGLGIGDIKKITDSLTSKPITVATTHVHWDHIGGHGRYERIFVHELEKDWLESGIKGMPIEVIRRDVGRNISRPVPDGFNPASYEPYRGQAAGLLQDNDNFDLGGRLIRVLHTPGHSPGHISLLDLTNGYLFPGDLLYEGTIFAFYPTTDPKLLMQSLDKISLLPDVARIFASHHRLELAPAILAEVKQAVRYVNEHGLACHGSGTHEFSGFSLKF